jgi:hypothetical protein
MGTDKPFVSEEVNDVIDVAKQIAAAFDEFDWKHYTQAASMLLLVREVKFLRHHLSGED